MTAAPVLKYSGSKWRIADWIVAQLPPHRVYLEPYFGSGAVFFRKPPAELSTINDLDGDVVNLFRVLRDRPDDLARAMALTPYARAEYETCRTEPHAVDPVEDARRFLARTWMAHGMRTDRLTGWAHTTGASNGTNRTSYANRALQFTALPKRIAATLHAFAGVQIEHRPALDCIARYAHADCLIYADPPYVLSTRAAKQYAHEMTDSDHLALLDVLDAHPGPVLLSGYRCPLYDERLAGWQVRTKRMLAGSGKLRDEVLWLNPVAANAQRQMGLVGPIDTKTNL